jgi:hypothetical protein
MKRINSIVVFITFFISVLNIKGQPDRERIELLRVNFISKKTDLTNSESEKFWPVYNEYNSKIKAIKRNLRQHYKQKNEVISDKEAEELYNLEQQSRQVEFDLHKLYSEKIKSIIGLKKFVKLRLAEEEFKQEIINTLKEKE